MDGARLAGVNDHLRIHRDLKPLEPDRAKHRAKPFEGPQSVRERGRDIEMRRGLTLSAFVEPHMLTAEEEDLRHSKIVTAAPWHAAAMLITTSLERDGEPVASFASYREALLRQFWSMRDLSPTEFEAALHKPGEVELEVERENVLRTLAAQRGVPA